MMPQTTRQSKPHVIPVCLFSGRFKVLSSDGLRYYHTDVLGCVCDCAAGRAAFRSCKRTPGQCRHIRVAAYLWRTTRDYKALAAMPIGALA